MSDRERVLAEEIAATGTAGGGTRVDLDRLPVIGAAAVLMAITSLGYNVMPAIVGSATRTLGLDEAQAGLVVSFWMAGASAATLSSPLWIRRLDWRRAVLAATGVSCIALVVAGSGLGLGVLFGGVAVSGFGLGGAYAIGTACIGDTSRPDRNFGAMIVIQVWLASAVVLALPWVDERWGLQGVLGSLAGLGLGCAVLVAWLPRQGREHPVTASSGPGEGTAPRLVWIALLALLLFFVATGSVWAFLELIGRAAGIAESEVAAAISLGLFVSALGAVGAIALAGRVQPIPAIITACVAILGAFLALRTARGFAPFVAAACVYQIGWSLALAFQLGLVARIDTTGRMIGVTAAAGTIGAVVGPPVAGYLANRTGSYDAVFAMGAAALLASAALYLGCARHVPAVGGQGRPPQKLPRA